jgi:GNAT superfamily N-acetyltransferase
MDLARVANEHWRLFYRNLVESLGGKWRRFGAVDSFSTPHLPAPFANGLLVIEPAQGADVVRAIEWVSEPGVPFRVRIDTSLGSEVLEAPLHAGLERDYWTMPGMVLTPVPAAPAPATGVITERVVASNFDDFIQATVDCGMPRPIAENAFDLRATKEGGVDFFLGRLDGRPAATATLIRTDDVAGIYAVATVDDARRRGLGSAVTWAAVDRAREWGSAAVVLQSSPMALHIYEQIGFQTVVEYAVFLPPHDHDQVTQ